MKIPTSEQICVTYVRDDIDEYVITRNIVNRKFTLYKIVDNDYQKMKIATSPLEFDDIVKKDRSK